MHDKSSFFPYHRRRDLRWTFVAFWAQSIAFGGDFLCWLALHSCGTFGSPTLLTYQVYCLYFAYHSYIYLIDLNYTTYFFVENISISSFLGCKLKFKKDVYSIRTYIHICKSHSEVQNQIIEIIFDNWSLQAVAPCRTIVNQRLGMVERKGQDG